MRSVDAYASVRDSRAPAGKQHLNVSEVVRRELAGTKTEDTLVLGAPSVDITNQDTSQGLMEENVIQTIASSIAMVESAKYALKTGKVKQVILTDICPDMTQKKKTNTSLSWPGWQTRSSIRSGTHLNMPRTFLWGGTLV